ncbi:hypothetical protein BH09SUM1_BH09SUM1_22720 [soil metagenome]
MSKYSQAVVDDLLQHLDALDVLELIDYHPESMQRNGDIIVSYCPLSQNHSGRYLTVHIKTRQFESTPPTMPEQRGSIIDLFARCRRIPFDDAMEKLADEFRVLLVESAEPGALQGLLDQARDLLTQAEPTEGKIRDGFMEQAEKRLHRLGELEPENIGAQRELFRLRLLQKNLITLHPVTARLMVMEKKAGNAPGAIEAAQQHLIAFPNDFAIRRQLADTLIESGETGGAIGELMTLADFAEQANQVDAALSAYRRVQDLGDHGVDVHPMIVALLMTKQRREEAGSEMLRRVDELRADKHYAEALETARRMLVMAPASDATKLQIVELTILCGMDDEALEKCLVIVDELLEASNYQKATEALRSLAASRPENIMIMEMLVTARRHIAEDSETVDLQHRLVELHRKHGDPAAALLMLEEMLSSNPDDVRTLRAMASFLDAEGEEDRIVPLLRRIAEIERASGNVEEALVACREILLRSEIEKDAHEWLIELLFETSRDEEAVKQVESLATKLQKAGEDVRLVALLQRTHERAPNSLVVIVMLSSVLKRLGDVKRSNALLAKIGGELLSAMQFEQAEKTVRELLEADPENPQLHEILGSIYHSGNKLERAKKSYLQAAGRLATLDRPADCRAVLEKVLSISPNDMEVLGSLSDLCTELGDEAGVIAIAERQIGILLAEKKYDQVVEQAQMILELQPDHSHAHQELIAAYEGLGDAEQANRARRVLATVLRAASKTVEEADLLREIVRRQPDSREALERLIAILSAEKMETELARRVDELLALEKDHPERGIRHLRELVKEHKNNPDLRLRLARLFRDADRMDDMVAELQTTIEHYEAEKNFPEARKLYKEILEHAPESVSTRAGLIELLRREGPATEAVQHYLILARQFQKARKLNEAAQAFEEIYQLDPESEELHRSHASLLKDMGKDDEAAVRLRSLASVFGQQGKHEKAISVLMEILDDQPGNLEVRREIIAFRRASGKTQQAVEDLNSLAALLHEEGDEEGAIGARREAADTMPDAPEIRLMLIKELQDADRKSEAQAETLALAQVYSNSGRHEKGLSVIDGVLAENPSNINARRTKARIYDTMGDEKRALAEYRELQLHLDSVSLKVAPTESRSPSNDENYPQLQLMNAYDFDSFVVGSRNNFAYATAKAVAEHPGSARNPLFLYADVGLGKTHLLHAIANYLKAKRPDIRILYTSTEYFTSELIDAIQSNTVTQFRNKHQQSDVLLLDDVQFLAGKERAQEEFFHIFNLLYQKQRQIVVTSDRPPKDIEHLNMRLRSRFGQGVIVDIQTPDADTRLAILKAENARGSLDVPDPVLQVLAERVASNVRELKGAYNQLITQHEIGGLPLDQKTANAIVDKYFTG